MIPAVDEINPSWLAVISGLETASLYRPLSFRTVRSPFVDLVNCNGFPSSHKPKAFPSIPGSGFIAERVLEEEFSSPVIVVNKFFMEESPVYCPGSCEFLCDIEDSEIT